MKNFTFKSVLAAAALLLGTTGSWAYEVPDGMEIKQVLIGNQNGTVVDPLTFDTEGDAVPTFGNKANFAIADEVPTDVWNNLALHMSGKSLRLGSRTTHEIDFTAPLTSGKVVFSSDFYVGIHAKSIKFIDADDNVVLYFTFPDKSATNGRVYGTQYLFVPGDEAAVFSSTPKMNDTYMGTRNREYQISELVFDLDNNKITYSGKIMDRRSSTNMWCADNATITLSKSVSIKGMIIDASACGSSSYYAYFDNMLLYNVGIKAGAHNYTINAVAGGETIKKLGSGVANEGDAYAFAVSEVIEKDGQYYVLDDANVENYKVSYVMGNADEVKEINYVLDESIVYYAEGETLGSTSELDGASNGFYGHVVGGNGQSNTGYDIGSLAAGTYQASAYFVSADVTKNRGFRVRNTAIANADDANVIASINTTQAGLYTSEIFVISSEMDLSVSGKTTADGKVNQSSEFDYIIIRKVEDPSIIGAVDYSSAYNTVFGETMSFTDGSTKVIKFQNHSKGEAVYQGFNVMVSENATEFAALTSDWRDNYSDVADNWVTRYQVSSDGGENFDWIDWTDNTMAADLTNAYVELTMNYKDGTFSIKGTATNGSKVYAYNWKTEGHTGTISAKMSVDAAWLKIISVEESQEGGETGIAKINNKANVENNVYFNMAGQRVAQPAKGLYIVNGKKVVIK